VLFPGNSAIFSFNGSDCSIVILAAGGMHMVDPLFQRVLVNECRSKRIPVIFDEVFTGFWRLGTEVGCPLVTFKSFFSLGHLIRKIVFLLADCSRPTLLCTRYSLLCEADDWWDCTLGCHIGNKCCIYLLYWRLKGNLLCWLFFCFFFILMCQLGVFL
jgi:hypothetical protein